MKRQKIRLHTRQAMIESSFGSTERDDRIDLVEDKYHLSSGQLRASVLNGLYIDYWNR